MVERPILFSAPMVRALLAGTKTQTRRIVKGDFAFNDDYKIVASPHGMPGDRLWVREAWRSGKLTDQFSPAEMTPHPVWYEADGRAPEACSGRYRHARFMPRWASRITLEITGVRVERLQDISQADAMAEGAPPSHRSIDKISRELGYEDFSRSWYAQLWNQINGPGSWEANPWVWVVEFRRASP